MMVSNKVEVLLNVVAPSNPSLSAEMEICFMKTAPKYYSNYIGKAHSKSKFTMKVEYFKKQKKLKAR